MTAAPFRATNPVALGAPNCPLGAWWVAATAAEIGDAPVQRWLLGLPVVLYRGADGRVVALDDRCPHRWAPLSLGRVHGDDIACAYHGFRFGPDGRCTHVPTQATSPAWPGCAAIQWRRRRRSSGCGPAIVPPQRRRQRRLTGPSIRRASPPPARWRSPATTSRSRRTSSISATSPTSMPRRWP